MGELPGAGAGALTSVCPPSSFKCSPLSVSRCHLPAPMPGRLVPAPTPQPSSPLLSWLCSFVRRPQHPCHRPTGDSGSQGTEAGLPPPGRAEALLTTFSLMPGSTEHISCSLSPPASSPAGVHTGAMLPLPSGGRSCSCRLSHAGPAFEGP